jgi:hypothetical protein
MARTQPTIRSSTRYRTDSQKFVAQGGVNTERVDTRVVQVIFAIDTGNRLVREQKVLVGQLVDVFIDVRPASQPRAYPDVEADK